MTLQARIERFVTTYAPLSRSGKFVEDLREVMAEYARAALEHGDLPDVGVQHKIKPPLAPWIVKYCCVCWGEFGSDCDHTELRARIQEAISTLPKNKEGV